LRAFALLPYDSLETRSRQFVSYLTFFCDHFIKKFGSQLPHQSNADASAFRRQRLAMFGDH
jgi:hypothetical protein